MNTLGRDGEEIALKFLKRKGYSILERNFRNFLGEIDIIARDRGIVVFVEVKTRSDSQFGQPFEAVTPRKKEKIKKIALSYLKRLKEESPARFDVLSIVIGKSGPRIEHIEDAFEV